MSGSEGCARIYRQQNFPLSFLRYLLPAWADEKISHGKGMEEVMPGIQPVLILRFGLANASLPGIAVGRHIFQFFSHCSENFIAFFLRENVGRIQSIGMIHQGVGKDLFHLLLSSFLIFFGKHFHIKGKGGVLYAVISLGIKVYKHRFRLFLGNPQLVGKLYAFNPQFLHKKCGQNLLRFNSGINAILTPNHSSPFPSFFPSF